MPIDGRGMLVNFMDVDAADEADFNRWYDKEHVAERVAIPGFVEARRYAAPSGPAQYLALYTTESFETLSSPAYGQALQDQTEWSRRNIAKFRNPTRAVARITASCGQGRGGALAFLRIRPARNGADALRAAITDRFTALLDRDGVVSAHLIESDPELSKPLVAPPGPVPGAGDWFALIDGTAPEAVRRAGDALCEAMPAGELVSSGAYRLLWDLSRAELNR